jgi:two-component system heavy metal sensor histidine kinase CusS
MLILLVAILAMIRATLTPVETLATRIALLDPGRPDLTRLDVDVPADFRPIVATLDELLGKVRKAIEREQTFTADFAHEMRTPVAGLRSTLEVALTRERSKGEYTEVLTECLDVSKSLHRLTETMLMLRRIESGSAQPRNESFTVSDSMDEIAETLSAAAEIRRMEIKTDIESGLTLHTDRPLMELAIRNLLENAVAHGQEGSDITVRGRRTDGIVRLEFRNAGGPKSQEEATALRDRFRRGDRSREATGGHFGLGLALTDAIGQVLGFQIDIQVNEPGEFSVTLRFTTDPQRTRNR